MHNNKMVNCTQGKSDSSVFEYSGGEIDGETGASGGQGGNIAVGCPFRLHYKFLEIKVGVPFVKE